MKIILLIILLSIFYGCSMAQKNVLPKPNSCYVIRKIVPEARVDIGDVRLEKFVLYDICLDEKTDEKTEVFVEQNGITKSVKAKLIKAFNNGIEAQNFARENKITDSDFIKIADCQIIRIVNMPMSLLGKKVENAKPEIVLLNTCIMREKEWEVLPKIKLKRNGTEIEREFWDIRTFKNRVEAEEYARQNGLTDVDFNQNITSMLPEKLEKSASCYVIVFKEVFGSEFPFPKFQLLDICPNDKKSLPKIKIRRNGKDIETSFEVKKVFETKEEAKSFADKFGVTDESMRLMDIPKWKLIRVIEMPLRKRNDAKTTPTIALLDVCLPSEANNMQHPMITFQENGRQVSRIFEVIQTFANKRDAESFAKENFITDIQISQKYLDFIADCHVIRIEQIPLTKKANVQTESKIVLLNTCLNDEIPQQRPVIELIRNGKTEFREYEIIKIFADKTEAEIYAKENGLIHIEVGK